MAVRGAAFSLALSACLAGCVPAGPGNDPPSAYRTYRGNLVVPDSAVPGQFEVFSIPGDGARDLWCAAAKFAQKELYALPNRRIYVVRPRGPSETNPGATSVVFTVSPDAALLEAAAAIPQNDINLDVGRPGRNFRMAHGLQTCRPIYEFWWDR
jgi:hypothetical protein